MSHNSRIRYVPNEIAAVRKFNVFLLILVGKVSTEVLAQNFVRTLPQIETFLERHHAPFIAKVYCPSPSDLARAQHAPGRIEPWAR